MSIKDFVIKKLDGYDQEEMSEEVIGEVVDEVITKYGVICGYFHAGSFDSVGYDCDYYVIVFVNEEGKLEGVDVQVESF